MRYQAPLASRLVLYEDACRDAVRMIPPSWSLIKWLCQKPAWNCFLLNTPRDLQPGLRGFFPLGTTTLFGPYVNSFFEFTNYAFGSVCATSGIGTLALHFGFGAEQACSAAARGHLLAAHLGPSLRPRFVLRFSSFTRRFLIPRFAACGSSSGVVHSPFFVGYVFFFAVLYSRRVLLLELTDVFPVCGRPRLQPSFSVSPHSCVSQTCFPTAFEYVDIFTFLCFFHFTVLVYDVYLHFLSVFLFKFQVAWSGVRIVSFTCLVFTAELEWSSRLVALLRIPSRTGCPLCSGFRRPQVPLRSACLEG